jgi:hypothetical protein
MVHPPTFLGIINQNYPGNKTISPNYLSPVTDQEILGSGNFVIEMMQTFSLNEIQRMFNCI